MKTVSVSIPADLSARIQACQIELEGLKSLIGYFLSTTEYEVPTEKINEFQTQFMLKNKEYNELKLEIENYIPSDFNLVKTSWNLDFATSTAVITEM